MSDLKRSSAFLKFEHQLLSETESGREALAVMERIARSQTGSQRIAKAIELTEITRRIMRDGIRAMHPEASESEIQAMYVDRLLSCHGTSVAQLRAAQAAELGRPISDCLVD